LTGDKQIAYTVGEMKRLIRTYASDTDRYGFKNVFDVFDFVRRIPYVRDVDAGYDELLKRPSAGARSGDCDDKTIFAAAALSGLGIGSRIVAVSYRTDLQLGHVYLEVFTGGEWKPFDATYPENRIFEERPYTRKVYGDDLVRHYTMHGVTTLEGFGDGSTPVKIPDLTPWIPVVNYAGKVVTGDASFNVASAIRNVGLPQAIAIGAAAAQAAIPIPGIGAAIGSLVGAIAGLIGLKGPTAHASYDEASAYANRIAKMIADTYARLPVDGKDFMAVQVKAFVDKMLADFGKWWGGMDLGAGDDPAEGFLNRIYRQGVAKGWMTTQSGFVFYSIMLMVYGVMRAADAETVKDNFQSWVWDARLKPIVLDPVQQYVKTRFQQVIEFTNTGTVTTPNPGGPITGTGMDILGGLGQSPMLIVGLVLAALAAFGGKLFETQRAQRRSIRRRR
jgi:hypothetical protein